MYSSVPSPPPQWNPGPVPTLERTRTASSPPPTSPTSPTRTGRLRGLSYLRSYTQNHILSRDNHSSSSTSQRPLTLGRATSYPSPSSSRGSASAVNSPAPQNTIPHQTSPTAQRSTSEVPTARSNNQETVGSTSGWLPTVGGLSGVSRIGSEPRSTATASSSAVLAGNDPTVVASDLTASMVRTRSATMGGAADIPHGEGSESQPSQHVNGNNGMQGMTHQLPSIRFSAHQDPRAQRPSLVFGPMSRILPTGSEIIKVGRYSERDNQPVQAVNVPSAAPVGFKSKVVSRRHCEFWCAGGRWFIKDVKSSSGTFLNHIRLSSPGTESRPFPVNDGDIVQLGIDFKGGEEMIFRCVKIRVELNKGWQTGPSSFNVQSHKRLRELNSTGKPPAGGSSQDCSICLGPIAPCQSLFVAPCSHTWHYKCIRVIINGPHWPHFICPNCRTVADLEAELDDPYANGEWEEVEVAEVANTSEQAAEESEGNTTARTNGQNDKGDETRVIVEAEDETSSRSHNGSSDGEVADSHEDAGLEHIIDQAADDLGYLHIEGSPSPSESTDSHPAHVSNSTVAPVDIIARKPVPNPSSTTSRLEQPNSRLERSIMRTPSPNGLGSSLAADTSAGAEGPMTPRNDAGPFIFDGSAGRPSDLRLAAMATMNLNAAANTPPPHVESEPTS
ncbi:hypothetical protein EG329_005339 [Mollisiaceae sp. DMI_Dod_QoI]|nr:hypothetical protein EG329_005339 [Helotiales sp. DMI_Dod_QoI]